MVAIKGFLFLIIQQLRAACLSDAHQDGRVRRADDSTAVQQPSSSQASLSQLCAISSEGAGLTLLQELLGLLRKALTQQAAVRIALYEGVLQVITPMTYTIACQACTASSMVTY